MHSKVSWYEQLFQDTRTARLRGHAEPAVDALLGSKVLCRIRLGLGPHRAEDQQALQVQADALGLCPRALCDL